MKPEVIYCFIFFAVACFLLYLWSAHAARRVAWLKPIIVAWVDDSGPIAGRQIRRNIELGHNTTVSLWSFYEACAQLEEEGRIAGVFGVCSLTKTRQRIYYKVPK